MDHGTKQQEVRAAPEENDRDWKLTEVREKWPVLYIAPFRSAILYAMLASRSGSSRLIVFAECAGPCNRW